MTAKIFLRAAICLTALFLLATPLHAAQPVIVPYPAQIVTDNGGFALKGDIVIWVPAGDREARNVAMQLRDMLLRPGTPGLHLSIAEGTPPATGPAIVLVRTPASSSEEAYGLTVDDNRVEISAANRKGLFYGAVTVWQLATQGTAGPPVLPAVTIADTPRYGWRGLLVDSARHFQSVDELKQLIDAMAAFKLNILHWHLADDQGWRLQIKAYPKLTEIGAWRAPKGADSGHTGGKYGGFYTQDQVRDLVAYAQARNITIVPEIELPGHASAALTAYPEYGVTGQVPASGMSDWGVYSNLYSIDDKTFTFLDTTLDEVMDLFPSPYIHIGGDEAIKNQWQASPDIQAHMKALGIKDEGALQSWFIARVGEHLTARGRHLIGWDEILEGGPAPDSVIMSWRGLDGAAQAARLGHDTILTPQPALYLDSRQSLSPNEPPGRSEVSTLQTVYMFDTQPAGIPPEQYHHILGVQANAWTEHMRTAKRLQEMAFPRLTALAETGWTPEAARSWTRFSAGLPVTLGQLRRLGMAYDSVPFEPLATLSKSDTGITAALASPLAIGDIRYTTDGSAPSPQSPLYESPLNLPEGTRLQAQTFEGETPLGVARSYDISTQALDTRSSSQLQPCSTSVPLRLEDDAPASGKRPVFMISIYKPCWVWPAVDLSHGLTVTARIGQAPFNFQLAGGRRIVQFDKPALSPYGELIVRQRTGEAAVCEGATLAVIPLSKAVDDNPELSVITGHIAAGAGVHDLCMTFNRPSAGTLWAIDQISLVP